MSKINANNTKSKQSQFIQNRRKHFQLVLFSLDFIIKFEKDIGETGDNVVLVIVILCFSFTSDFLTYPVKLCNVRRTIFVLSFLKVILCTQVS